MGQRGSMARPARKRGARAGLTAWVVIHADWIKRDVVHLMFGGHLNGACRVLVRMAR